MEITQKGIKFGPEDVDTVDRIIGKFKSILIPKNKKNKIGIIIAIKTEDEDANNRLENDFIEEVNKHLKNPIYKNQFNVIRYPLNIIDKIQDGTDALHFLRSSKSHLIIHGSVVKRKIQGQENYIFKLNGAVRHAPIPLFVSKNFSKEFRTFLPNKIIFKENDEAFGFETTGTWIQYAIRYVIGMASFISGDLVLSENMFNKLKDDILKVDNREGVPILYELKYKVTNCLSEIMLTYLDINYNFFIHTRNPEYILIGEPFLKKVQEYTPDNYHGHIYRSIYYFFKKDIQSAIKEMENINNNDVSWRYNLGFLLAYDGNIDGALKNYQKILYRPNKNIIDIEVFITEAIEKEPDKCQLVFFRGLINYKIKNDYKLATNDLTDFLNHKNSINFPRLIELAKKYSDELSKNIGY